MTKKIKDFLSIVIRMKITMPTILMIAFIFIACTKRPELALYSLYGILIGMIGVMAFYEYKKVKDGRRN